MEEKDVQYHMRRVFEVVGGITSWATIAFASLLVNWIAYYLHFIILEVVSSWGIALSILMICLGSFLIEHSFKKIDELIK